MVAGLARLPRQPSKRYAFAACLYGSQVDQFAETGS